MRFRVGEGLGLAMAGAQPGSGAWLLRVGLLVVFAGCFGAACLRLRGSKINGKCAASLLLVLAAIVLGLGYEALRAGLPALREARYDWTAGVALGLVLVASLVVGMLGLMELQDRRHKRTTGRSWGVLAIALSVVLLTAMLGAGPGNIWSLPTLLTPFMPTGPPGPSIHVTEYNYEFASPGAPWEARRAGETNQPLVFERVRPDLRLEVSGEKYGQGFDSDQLAEAGRARLRRQFRSEQVVGIRPETVNELQGLRVETRGVTDSEDLVTVQWYYFRNGFGYQLQLVGPARLQRQVLEEAKRVFSGFRLIDAYRRTDEAGQTFDKEFTSSNYGYEVSVVSSAWRRWPGLQREMVWFEFGARQETGAYMGVVPVWFGEQLEEDAIYSALLRAMNIDYPDEALTDRNALEQEEAKGVQFDFQRYVNGVPFRYRLRLLHRDGYAWLVGVWQAADAPDFDQLAEDAFGRVRFKMGGLGAPDLSKQSGAERLARGMMLNEAGGYFFERKEFRKARRLFLAAHESSPSALYFQNALAAWAEVGDPEGALAIVEKELQGNPRNALLRSYQARFLEQKGDLAKAAAIYEQLLAEGARQPELIEKHISVLVKLNREEDARRVLRRQYEETGANEFRVMEANVYRRQGKVSEAIALLKDVRAKAPFARGAAEGLALALVEAERFEEGLKVCREILARSEPDAMTLTLKGRCEAELGKWAEAKLSYEAALKLSPGNADLVRSLEVVSGALGVGSTAGARAELEAVKWPMAVAQDLEGKVPEGYGAEFGAYYELRLTAVRFEEGGARRETDFGRVRLLDAAGVAAFSTIEIPFDPLVEDIALNEVRVLDDAGVRSEGKPENLFVADDTSSGMATHKKVLKVPIAGLRPGATVEFTVTRKTAPGADASPFLEYLLSRSFPVRRSAVFLSGTVPGLRPQTTQGVRSEAVEGGTLWWIADAPVARPEPLQPAPAVFLPTVWLGREAPQWGTLANRYVISISDRLQLSEELREAARRIAGAGRSVEERVQAMARHVQTNYTYQALEFGRRGRVPDTPAQMSKNRYGDCKDHSVMLQQMLETVGIPARLALVNSSTPVVKELPSLEQFDHMIVFVPGGGVNGFVDVTQKGSFAGHGPPPGLEGREALVLDDANPRFERIPALIEPTRIQATRTVTITNEQDAVVREELLINGVEAAQIRESLLNIASVNHQLFVQDHLGSGNAELKAWRLEHLADPSVPLVVHMEYVVRQAFHRVDDRLVGSVPGLAERYYLTHPAVGKRRSPFELRGPKEYLGTTVVLAPEGYAVEPRSNPRQEFETEFVRVRFGEEDRGRLRFELRLGPGLFPAEKYGVFREETSRACALVEQPITLKRVAQSR